MTEETVAAAAAAEPAAAPDTPVVENDPSPTPPDPSDPTPRASIDRAFDAVDKLLSNDEPAEPQKEQKQEAGPEKPEEKPKDERERNPDGTFKAKDKPEADAEPKPDEKDKAEKPEDDKKLEHFPEAPKRFSQDAKDAWKDAPLAVRAEYHRLEREFSAGLEKYRERAEAYGEFEDFANELNQTGQKFGDVVNHYRGIEDLLRRDPMQGLDQICRNLGTSLHDVAAKLTGQTPDQSTRQHHDMAHSMRQENTSLKNELNTLREEISGVRDTVTSQAEKQVMDQINEFAKSHPRFEELSGDIQIFLETGRAQSLPEAYGLAERLNPAPDTTVAETAKTQATASDADTKTRKGQLSPTGAPGSGSNPKNRQAPATARDAVDQAFDRVFG